MKNGKLKSRKIIFYLNEKIRDKVKTLRAQKEEKKKLKSQVEKLKKEKYGLEPRHDIHTHLDLCYWSTPAEITAGRIDWPLDKLEKLAKWYLKHRVITIIAVSIYNFFKRDISLRYLLTSFMLSNPAKNGLAQIRKEGMEPLSLLIDYQDNDTKRDWKRRALMVSEGIQYACWEGETLKIYPAICGVEKVKEILRRPEVKRAIIHCSMGGIGEYKEANNPGNYYDELWRPDLKVLFAHFGGGKKEWRNIILEYMQEFRLPCGSPRVYSDTAFHDSAISSTAEYFKELEGALFLAPDCICFGSDYPLHTIFYSYSELIKVYKKNLGDYYWNIITKDNPARFLQSEGTCK